MTGLLSMIYEKCNEYNNGHISTAKRTLTVLS